jgi:hypothetical protein
LRALGQSSGTTPSKRSAKPGERHPRCALYQYCLASRQRWRRVATVQAGTSVLASDR